MLKYCRGGGFQLRGKLRRGATTDQRREGLTKGQGRERGATTERGGEEGLSEGD